MIKDPFFAYITDSLHNALVRLSSNELQEMPVVSNDDNRVLWNRYYIGLGKTL